MNGCTTCGGFAGRHDPITHDAEPQEDTVTEPTDELREALAEALYAADDWTPDPTLGDKDFWGHYADALLPVVTAWVEQRARERAADAWSEGYWAYSVRGSNPYADDRPDPGRC